VLEHEYPSCPAGKHTTWPRAIVVKALDARPKATIKSAVFMENPFYFLLFSSTDFTTHSVLCR
jgi:hypothetical protein